MQMINNGEIVTQNTINEEQKETVKRFFTKAEVWKNTIQINEEYGDIESDLGELCEWLAKNGNPVTDVSIRCYGDYDGGYTLRDGYPEWCDADEGICLNNTETEDLIKELANRGYECVKKDEPISVGTVVNILIKDQDDTPGKSHKSSTGVVMEIRGTDYAVAEERPEKIAWYKREQITAANMEDVRRFVMRVLGI